MAHVARNFTVKPSEWVQTFGCQAPVAWPNAEDKEQGQRGSTMGPKCAHEAPKLGFNLIQLDWRLQVVFAASPCLPWQMDHSGVQEAEVWPEDWVPRGSVRVCIGGLGRYSMIMIQLLFSLFYNQFPKWKDFGFEFILTGSCVASTVPHSLNLIRALKQLVPPKLSSWK